MTRQEFHTVEVHVPDGPVKAYLRHPDGRLVEDDRSCDQMMEAAVKREGKDGIVEVHVTYFSYLGPGWYKLEKQVKEVVFALIRRDFHVASNLDVGVEIKHKIVMYRK
jgi:hypothetical protein